MKKSELTKNDLKRALQELTMFNPDQIVDYHKQTAVINEMTHLLNLEVQRFQKMTPQKASTILSGLDTNAMQIQLLNEKFQFMYQMIEDLYKRNAQLSELVAHFIDSMNECDE